MSYVPTNWQTGDTITAEKLNNIENGIVANEGAIDSLEEAVTDSEVKWIVAKQYIDPQTQQLTGDFVIVSGSVSDFENFPNVKVLVEMWISGLDVKARDAVFSPSMHTMGLQTAGQYEAYDFINVSPVISQSAIAGVMVSKLLYTPHNNQFVLRTGTISTAT